VRARGRGGGVEQLRQWRRGRGARSRAAVRQWQRRRSLRRRGRGTLPCRHRSV